MFGKGSHRKASIRWRIALTYIVIVFIAMAISGVLILSQLESYNYNLTQSNLSKTAQSIMLSVPFDTYTDLKSNGEEIQAIVSEWRTGTGCEIFIVDPHFRIAASDNANMAEGSAINTLDSEVIIGALNGQESVGTGTIQNGEIPVMNMATPIIGKDNQVIGVLYLRSDLSEMHKTIRKSKIIFLESMSIALVITFLISLLIAVTISEPINVVTRQAEIMAGGDLSTRIPVNTNDEVGRLAQMFNVMGERLDRMISEISGEKTKLEAILNSLVDGLIVIDIDGFIIHANPAAIAMFNMSPWDIMEEPLFDDIMDSEIKEQYGLSYRQIFENLKKGTDSVTLELGTAVYEATYADFKDDDGKKTGIIILFRNITEAVKIEKMQTDFVANVSHELKTPITTIKSYAETLVDNDIDDKETVHHFLSVIDNEADRMGRLVKDLLLLSRLDYNSDPLEPVEADLTEFIYEIVSRVSINAKNKSQKLEIIYDRRVPQVVFIDTDRMEQVLLNVISNAIKYTPEGGLIQVDLRSEAGYSYITVKDNGIGMTQEEADRMFERFFRADKARTRAEGGTGLGMAISKQIVEGHKGKISVESKLGEGTTMTIKLPLSWSRGRKNID